MATTLLGRHVEATCPDCKFIFSRDAEDENSQGTAPAVCPNCGARFVSSAAPRVLSGDRVLIDRTAFQFRRPRRWEVVAFHHLEGERQDTVVKRVVGLPSETIQIKDGDIYVDGRIQRKDLRQQRAMRILVHDDDCAGPSPRWRPQEAGSNWIRQHGRLVHAENTGDDIGWLVYNHAGAAGDDSSKSRPNNNFRISEGDSPIFVERKSGQSPTSFPAGPKSARITDYAFYNRGRLQRNEDIHPVADVAMSFHIEDVHGHGLLWLEASDGRDEFMAAINPGTGKYKVERNRQAVTGAAGDLPGSLRGQTVEVSLFDRQFLLSIAGRTLAAVNIDTPGPPPFTEQPLAIGAEGLGIAVDRLRVYRDVYYTEPRFAASRGVASACALGPDEYFVLGDNSPISEDSRSWTEDPLVNSSSLAGKPFVVIYASREISLGGWPTEVPDFSRIRYIR